MVEALNSNIPPVKNLIVFFVRLTVPALASSTFSTIVRHNVRCCPRLDHKKPQVRRSDCLSYPLPSPKKAALIKNIRNGFGLSKTATSSIRSNKAAVEQHLNLLGMQGGEF